MYDFNIPLADWNDDFVLGISWDLFPILHNITTVSIDRVQDSHEEQEF